MYHGRVFGGHEESPECTQGSHMRCDHVRRPDGRGCVKMDCGGEGRPCIHTVSGSTVHVLKFYGVETCPECGERL